MQEQIRILFFNINGSGMGHMNRCLSYARPLQGKAHITFFSLASAIEIIESMGESTPFDTEYYVSPFWSTNANHVWNTELAFRLSMVLEHVQPHIIVFDGTWPYNGFLGACKVYGKAKFVWSNRGLLKKNAKKTPVAPHLFDLILEPGELLSSLDAEIEKIQARPYKVENKLCLSPVNLFRDNELLDKENARKELDLDSSKKYALLSLGPGNLKDVNSVGHTCIELLQKEGYTIFWACAPISVNDVELPDSVTPLSVYPLVRILRAFDIFIGAAGYNTCCEVVQVQIPTLLIPNTLLADDQSRRAHLVAENSPTIVCLSENKDDLQKAIQEVVTLSSSANSNLQMTGAIEASEALLDLSKDSSTANEVTKFSWKNGPSWAFILKYYNILSSLTSQKPRSFINKSIYLLLQSYRSLKIKGKDAWLVDLKHSAPQENREKLLVWAEGFSKEKQRQLCQEVVEYIKENPNYIPILVTDTPDFAYFSRLHWLVEYLPTLRERKESNYKQTKREYLKWRYRSAKVFSSKNA